MEKMKTLTEQDLMQLAGITAFEKRKDEKSKIYSFEQAIVKLNKQKEQLFKPIKKREIILTHRPPHTKKQLPGG